jgi:hypothetical protein
MVSACSNSRHSRIACELKFAPAICWQWQIEKYDPAGAPSDITEPLKKNRAKALRDIRKKVEERFKS